MIVVRICEDGGCSVRWGGGGGGREAVGGWIRRCGVNGIKRLRHRNSCKVQGPLFGWRARGLFERCCQIYLEADDGALRQGRVNLKWVDWGGYQRATDMDIKHKRARDRWSHVRMFWGWGGVGRDRIQVDRLMGLGRTEWKWVRLCLDSLPRLKRVPFHSDSFGSVAGLHTPISRNV